MTTDTKRPVQAPTKAKEISEDMLDKVAGGLNPQPLPPRWGGRGGF